MTIRLIATTTAFAALSLVAGTTFCAGVASAEEVTAATAAPAKVANATADTRVCAKVEITGSRIARTVCQTRGEWVANQGIDPVAK